MDPLDPQAVAMARARGPWGRSPVLVDDALLAPVTAACMAAKPSLSPGQLVVADARGEGRVTLVYADATSAVACRARMPDADATPATVDAIDPLDIAPGPVGPKDITISSLEVLSEDPAEERSLLIGQVGSAAHAVKAGFDDESDVLASMANGWYVAWWPSNWVPAAVSAVDIHSIAIGGVTPTR